MTGWLLAVWLTGIPSCANQHRQSFPLRWSPLQDLAASFITAAQSETTPFMRSFLISLYRRGRSTIGERVKTLTRPAARSVQSMSRSQTTARLTLARNSSVLSFAAHPLKLILMQSHRPNESIGRHELCPNRIGARYGHHQKKIMLLDGKALNRPATRDSQRQGMTKVHFSRPSTMPAP